MMGDCKNKSLSIGNEKLKFHQNIDPSKIKYIMYYRYG